MSNDIKGLYIAFNEDLKEEYVDKLIEAIKIFRGIGSVEKSVVNFDDFINRARFKTKLLQKLFDVIDKTDL